MPQFKGIKTVPKIQIDNKDTLSLVYTPGVGASCLKIKENPEASMVYTNRINSVAVMSFDYQKSLQRAIFLKSVLLIDAYPFEIKENTTQNDLKFAIENLEINFCAIDLSLIQEFAKDIDFNVEIPVLKEPVSDLKDFFGAISRNVFMIDITKLKGDVSERSLQLHELAGGVIETELTEETRNKPVAIISDGTAVLGYGNIGALASLPVMEGKAALYADLADVDSVVFCTKTQNVDEIVKILQIFENSIRPLKCTSSPTYFSLTLSAAENKKSLIESFFKIEISCSFESS